VRNISCLDLEEIFEISDKKAGAVEIDVNVMKLGLHAHVFMVIVAVSLVIISQANMHRVSANPLLDVDVETNKQTYLVGDAVRITGNVTLDGTLKNNSLVAIEIDFPNGSPFALRTVDTGNVSGGYWKVKIADVYTSATPLGNETQLFNRGATAYVNVVMANIDVVSHPVRPVFYIQRSDNSPLMAMYMTTDFYVIEANRTAALSTSIQVPTTGAIGQTLIFASVFDDNVALGGAPYCPEYAAWFYIDTQTPAAPAQPEHFNVAFNLPKINAKLGNYTITARSKYQVTLATDIKPFEVILLGDVTGPTPGVPDGKVDMRDIGFIVNLYGTREGDPNWVPKANLYVDDGVQVINMRDIGIACNNFGKSGSY